VDFDDASPRLKGTGNNPLCEGSQVAFHNWLDTRISCENSGENKQGRKRKCPAVKELKKFEKFRFLLCAIITFG